MIRQHARHDRAGRKRTNSLNERGQVVYKPSMASDGDNLEEMTRGAIAQRRRAERQAAALRANLFRRKAQSRARRESDTSGAQNADEINGPAAAAPVSQTSEG